MGIGSAIILKVIIITIIIIVVVVFVVLVISTTHLIFPSLALTLTLTLMLTRLTLIMRKGRIYSLTHVLHALFLLSWWAL